MSTKGPQSLQKIHKKSSNILKVLKDLEILKILKRYSEGPRKVLKKYTLYTLAYTIH